MFPGLYQGVPLPVRLSHWLVVSALRYANQLRVSAVRSRCRPIRRQQKQQTCLCCLFFSHLEPCPCSPPQSLSYNNPRSSYFSKYFGWPCQVRLFPHAMRCLVFFGKATQPFHGGVRTEFHHYLICLSVWLSCAVCRRLTSLIARAVPLMGRIPQTQGLQVRTNVS